MLLGFAVAVLLMVAVAYVNVALSLRAENQAVHTAGARVREAERVLHDLQVVGSHGPSHPQAYLIVHRQQEVLRQRREDYNSVVARYNRTSDLHLAAWMYRWLGLPRQHLRISSAE